MRLFPVGIVAAAKKSGSAPGLDWTGAAMVCSFHQLVPDELLLPSNRCARIASTFVIYTDGEADPPTIGSLSDGDNVPYWYNQIADGLLGNVMESSNDVDLLKEGGTVPVISFNAE